jgi:acid phosphatase type 7
MTTARDPDSRFTRRQALALLGAPLLAAACGLDDAFGPRRSPAWRWNLGSSSPTDEIVTLIGANDQHAQATNAAHRTGAIVQAMLDADPTAHAFAIGDLVPHGTAEEYLNYDAAWGSFKSRTFLCLGNHDRIADPTATPFYDYAGEQAGPRGKGYFAVTLGAWRCYFMNSEVLHDEQSDWLATDLPQWAGYHKLAMWHTPMFASVCAHNGKAMTWPAKLGPWWGLLQQNGGELVVNGHVHRYERFARQLRDGTVSDQGMRQLILGTGGVKPMDILTVHPHSERQVITKGVTRLTLRPDGYDWSFSDLNGVVRDQGSEVCRA